MNLVVCLKKMSKALKKNPKEEKKKKTIRPFRSPWHLTYSFQGTEFYDSWGNGNSFEVGNGTLNFTDCTFLENKAFSIETESSLFINNCSFTKNYQYSSLIRANGPYSIIKNSYFANNEIDVNSSSLILEIYNSTFYRNIDNGWNDNIITFKHGEDFKIWNSKFIVSVSSIAIYAYGNSTKIQNCYFKVLQPSNFGSISFEGDYLYISNITMIGINNPDPNSFDHPSFIYVYYSQIMDIEDSYFEGYYNAAANLLEIDYINIKRSLFKNGSKSRALEISKYYECYLSDLKFINNTNSDTGGSIKSVNDNNYRYYSQSNIIIVDNCEFDNNQATNFGGAIVLDGCDAIIKNSKFTNNTSDIGGAIVSLCQKNNRTNYLVNNTFYHNKALIGGAVYWEGSYQNTSGNTFIANYAEYGNNTASQPVKLLITKPPYNMLSGSEIIEKKIVCGSDYIISFQAALIDIDNQTVSYGYDDSLAFLNCETNGAKIIGTYKEYPKWGMINFDSFSLSCPPGIEIVLSLSYSGKVYYYFNNSKFYNLPEAKIIIDTRSCEKGEYRDNDRCEFCEIGTFSLNYWDKCETCPNHAFCYGGYQIAPYKGYWHGSNESSTIYPCPNPDACRGGLDWEVNYTSLIGICAEGYRGNKCQPCDFGYSSSGRNKCEKCPSDQDTNAAKIIFIFTAAAISLTCIVYFSLKTAYEPKSTISVYFRILINYLQMITLVARLKLNWPFYIEYWLANQGYPGEVPTHWISLDCYLMDERDPDSYKTIYFKKLITIVALPAILGFAAFIFWSFIAIFQRNWKMMKNELIATICILLFLILPSITDYMFSIFSCTYIYDKLYLVSNLDIKCWNDDHYFYAVTIALPGIIVWSIGIPACVFLFLRKRKFKLHRLDTKLKFGFLYNGYRESTYYWEFIITIRKLMIICLTVFLTTETIEIQTASCASVFAVFYYIQKTYYPFEYENLNKAELGSNFVVLITTWCGLFYTGSGLNIFANIIFFFFILLANAYFVFMWTRTMIIELKLLAIEIFPIFKNYFDADELKIKKNSEMRPVFSLINQDEDSAIEIKLDKRIKNSVDLSILKIKENINIIEEQKDQSNDESSGELSVFGPFACQDVEEGT
ncbi:unnamed protein product [Blepharisma stoltei]|uniref:Right handed beta helix domain-containing protein n=1 Tax=Blepharisma stoltei TaxID=1481888 RepID=A0AAU9J4A4_9CILI|nr:unnamed protein product [Blepharisma stoltei]